MPTSHRRPALIILVIAAALVCLGLGWWQWGRFESSNGTGQNLGYALQWPLFAGFVIFAYFRFVRLESEASTEQDQEPEVSGTPETPDAAERAESEVPARRAPGLRNLPGQGLFQRRAHAPREIPAGILPERPVAVRDDDPVLAEYNRYLADLHAQDVREEMHAVGLDGTDTERRAG